MQPWNAFCCSGRSSDRASNRLADRASGNGATSLFASLLHQVALEHDREVMELRAKIARLTRTDATVDVGELVIESKADAPVGDADYDLGISAAHVMPIVPLSELEEQVAQEGEPIMLEWHNSHWPDLDNGSSAARSSRPSIRVSQRSPLNTKSPCCSLNRDVTEDSLDKSEDGKAAIDSPHSRMEPLKVENSLELNKWAAVDDVKRPLERWQQLIAAIDFDGNSVKLNPRWHELLERGPSSDPKDKKETQSLMDAISETVQRNASSTRHSKPCGFRLSHTASHSSGTGTESIGTKSARSLMSDFNFGLPSAMHIAIVLRQALVLHPNSTTRMCWDIFGMLILVHDLIVIPLQSFESGTQGWDPAYEKFTKSLDTFAIFFWTFDIFVSFLTGYYTREGFVEIRHRKIAINYIATWFPLDIIIVAVDWVNLALNLNSEVGYLRLGKTLSRFMRILRLLRFMKMSENLSSMLHRVKSEFVFTLVGVLKLLLGIVIVNHYIACGWWAMSQIRVEETWSKKFLSEEEEMGYAYATSLHWSLTQFTPASMEVHPTNQFERLYTIVVIIAAMVTFSSFVSSITGAMTHLRNINAKKAEQDAAIRKYFAQNKISHDLASQVWHFRRRNRMATKARIKEADLPALKYLPERMREKLRLEVYTPILQQHPLFSMYKDLCPQGVLQICNEALVERQVLAGEEVQELKERVKFMFFVCYGVLEYHTGDYLKKKKREMRRGLGKSFIRTSNENRRTMGSLENFIRATSRKTALLQRDADARAGKGGFQVGVGQWACEVALWSSMGRTAGPFVGGDSGCELVLLLADEFQTIVGKHPKGFQLMAQYSTAFIQRFNQAYGNPLHLNLLFNDVDCITDILKLAATKLDRKSKTNLGISPGKPFPGGKAPLRWGSGTLSFALPNLRATFKSRGSELKSRGTELKRNGSHLPDIEVSPDTQVEKESISPLPCTEVLPDS